ncbi:hypothetical protein AGLY_016637 [Aphis glycines]|uniref:PiggyBac transposable element-derived protein domain-containing protein n=1 Tax=Aphis glycines TaxID=307491 RepID=A0A6G0SXA5_APHGL|nr:hypothetical protein AGLY_016637 [Aphis glycines]
MLWMGLCPQPTLASYWTKDTLYSSNIPDFMKRKRFELILRTFHCCNNNMCPPGDRLYKVKGLLDILVAKYKFACSPKESMCIDESIVPFVGRLSFRQYIQNKRHRYGIKIFKLCINNFYTVGFKIYASKEADKVQSVSTKVVLEMAEDYLDMGRTMYTDNWYSSYGLAIELLNRKTHLVGTLRSNRKNNPKEVIQKKLKKGDYIAKQCNKGVTVLKWRDKRDVLIQKPNIIIDYNKGKSLVDVCDLRNSYHNPLRRTLKWYKKIAFELILNTSVLNALSLYEEVTKNKINVTSFREHLVRCLIKKNDIPYIPTEQPKHQLEETKFRGRCSECYKEMVLQGGRKHAQLVTRQIRTKCLSCNKFFCMPCFFSKHYVINKKLPKKAICSKIYGFFNAHIELRITGDTQLAVHALNVCIYDTQGKGGKYWATWKSRLRIIIDTQGDFSKFDEIDKAVNLLRKYTEYPVQSMKAVDSKFGPAISCVLRSGGSRIFLWGVLGLRYNCILYTIS